MVKTLKQLFSCLLLLAISVSTVFAQAKKVKEADRLFNNKEYAEALDAYKKASENIRGNKALKAEVTYKQALCFMAFKETKKQKHGL